MTKNVWFVSTGIFGILLAFSGAIVLWYFPKYLQSKITEASRIINGTDTFERWRKAPVPITMKFYIFELSNPDNLTSIDDIQLVERGPYAFDETRIKEQIVFFENMKNQSVVSYRERRNYSFNKQLSVGDYDDNITFINLPILGVVFNQLLTAGAMGFQIYEEKLNKNEKSLFTTRTVGQLLFDGINMELYSHLSAFVPKNSGIKMSNFSLFKGKSVLHEDLAIFTGTDNLENIGRIFRFDNKFELRNDDKKKTRIWPYHSDRTHQCNQLRGTDGSFFGPNIQRDDLIYAFEPQVCRSLFFRYLESSEVRGIHTLRFITPKEEFESPLKFNPNSCYCLKKDLNECGGDGALEISHCQRVSRGAPIVVSGPYFFNGGQNLRDHINLKPPKPLLLENYGSYIDIEPMTGAVLRAFKRIQLNIKVKHSDLFPELNATKEGSEYIIPLLWLEESAELDEKMDKVLKSMIFDKIKLIRLGSVTAVMAGAMITLVSSYLSLENSKSN